nr:nickel-dependent lactate racemase [Rhodopirellula sp. JC639]
MQVSLLYGRSGIRVALPVDADVTLIGKPEMPRLDDPVTAVRQALTRSPGSDETPGLQQIADGAASACIAICDITRPVPNQLFLRPMVETLVAAGVPLDQITVLVATGLHRPNLGDELAELVGDPWVLENVKVVNHDALCDEDHIDLGRTATRQTPIKIDRRFVQADVRIATGLVEPHFMAGYSGGRKVIAPGLAHADTIRTFHNHQFMSNPAAANCNLDRNPLHEEQLEIVARIGGAYALNTVIDEHRNLSMVNFGEITASHREAVSFIERYCRVAVPRPFPTVVTSAAGYPLDKTYYQTVKGMVGAMDILQPGGNLIIASQCGEGLGSNAYAAAQTTLTRLGPEGFLRSIRDKPFADIDEWQTQMQTKATQQGNVYLYSSLPPESRALTGVMISDDLEATIRASVDASACKRVAVIPEGPYVIPFVQDPGSPGGPWG